MVHPLQTNKRTGQQSGGVSAVSVPSHSVLSDLTTGDDHPQYVLADGTRAGWPVPTPTATDLAYDATTRLLTSSTGTDATLPLVSSADAGLAPASGGGTANFLRADGTWAAPSTGVTDHGALTGLLDNDHDQYMTTESYMQTTVANPDQCYCANIRTGVALGTKALAANTEYWIPFVAPVRGGTIGDVRIQVSTASAGTNIIVGLYACKTTGGIPDSGDFRPTGSSLASATQSTAATGSFTLAMSYALTAGQMYWFCILSSGAPTLRGGSTNSCDIALGWTLPSGTTAPTAVTHWTSSRTYASGLRTGMTGTETYTNGTGAQPCVFYTFSA